MTDLLAHSDVSSELQPGRLPTGAVPYRRTPVFTETSVPGALLHAHRTKTGVWALIEVLQGRLLYRVLDSSSEQILEPGGSPGVVEPTVPHEVEPLGPVRFQVTFYRLPERENQPAMKGA